MDSFFLPLGIRLGALFEVHQKFGALSEEKGKSPNMASLKEKFTLNVETLSSNLSLTAFFRKFFTGLTHFSMITDILRTAGGI